MHDDDSLERFLVDNKPLPPAPPVDELRHLSAQLSGGPHLGRRLLHRRPSTGFAAVFLSVALALLVMVARQPKPHHAGVPAADVEAVLTDSYGSLEDIGDDDSEDGSDLAWFEPGVSR